MIADRLPEARVARARVGALRGLRSLSLESEALADALAQRNASLPDWIDDALRRDALRSDAARRAFRRPALRVLARIARASLARRHHWSGSACRSVAGAGLRSARA